MGSCGETAVQMCWGCQGKACLCLCNLSPGVESWVPWGRLVLSCFCYCVVCLAVKQGESAEKAMPPLPILPHHLFLTVSNPTHLIFTISVMVCLLFYINSFASLIPPNLLSLRSYNTYLYSYILYHLLLCLISLFWLVVYASDTKIKKL